MYEIRLPPIRPLLVTAVLFLLLPSVQATAAPVELGKVHWLRSFEQARADSQRTGRPMLVLFDEVPGCSTVRRFGAVVLSHPLLVEAAERHFVPVVVHNNKGGADRRVLRSFGEPAWNNPVVRFIDASRRPLADRLDGDYTVAGLAGRMVTALERANRSVPAYLQLLAGTRAPLGRALFSMHCFWVCEVSLGSLPGVVGTRAGFVGGREVVEVVYQPRQLSYRELVRHASRTRCATRVYARNRGDLAIARSVVDRAAQPLPGRFRVSWKDTKYQLRGTAWRFVPLTETQASRVNAAVGAGKDPLRFLSGGQRRILDAIRRRPSAGWRKALNRGGFFSAYERAWSLLAQP